MKAFLAGLARGFSIGSLVSIGILIVLTLLAGCGGGFDPVVGPPAAAASAPAATHPSCATGACV